MTDDRALAGLTETTPDQPAPRPLGGAGERIDSLDFIRGIAVMGILFANITVMAGPSIGVHWLPAFPGGAGGANEAAHVATLVLVDGKMRGLFTLLFGAGLYLFMQRAWARGATRALQVRRLAWLFVFGALHFLLLFFGDILMLYAVAGLIALTMLRWRPATQMAIGLSLYIVFGLLLTALTAFPAIAEIAPEICKTGPEWTRTCARTASVLSDEMADAAREAAIYGSDSWAAVIGYNATEQIEFQLYAFLLATPTETLPLMLIGMAALRYGWFDGRASRTRLLRWGAVGIAAGLALTALPVFWLAANDWPYFSTLVVTSGVNQLARLPLVLGLAAVLGALGAGLARGPIGSRVAAAGRVAFSNYIASSLVMMLLFQGWALGLWGEVSRPGLIGIAAIASALMLAWSKPWLDRFRYGPLEWLWRCLTYGQRFALRRQGDTEETLAIANRSQ